MNNKNNISVKRLNLKLKADPKRVIIPLLYFNRRRGQVLISKIKKLTEEDVENYLSDVIHLYSKRHRDINSILMKNFSYISRLFPDISNFSKKRKLLTGSYFSYEYTFEGAALFNPSMVPHFDQSGLKEGEKRFIISLRSTGEGHISSITFRTGMVNERGDVTLDENPIYSNCSVKAPVKTYSKEFIKDRISYFENIDNKLIDKLPEQFTENEAQIYLQKINKNNTITKDVVLEIIDSNYDIEFPDNTPLNESVIFPNAKIENKGLEDARFVKFSDNDTTSYYATYTAYNGFKIKVQLIETNDFIKFKIRTLYGAGVQDKGMALFPEKINGKYAMITRQGGYQLNIMYSDNLYFWNDFSPLLLPERSWELVQIGNCGSPIKTKKGWLLLTHAVGPVRRYVISAALLDLKDPSKVISTLEYPLMEPTESERNGYVPNVLYSCGSMLNKDKLIIPYAMSDSATEFAVLDIDNLLNALS